MMSLRRTAAVLLALGLAPSAHADQFAYLDLPQAQAALARLHAGDVVHLYCAPCGEALSRRMTVRSPGIDRVWDRRGSARVYRDDAGAGYWIVEANDAMLDLAYVYVRDGRRWHNLAALLGLHPQGVPAELPRSATGTRWQCEGTDDNPYLAEAGRRDPCG
jgi:hypothetical protein